MNTFDKDPVILYIHLFFHLLTCYIFSRLVVRQTLMHQSYFKSPIILILILILLQITNYSYADMGLGDLCLILLMCMNPFDAGK